MKKQDSVVLKGITRTHVEVSQRTYGSPKNLRSSHYTLWSNHQHPTHTLPASTARLNGTGGVSTHHALPSRGVWTHPLYR